MFKLSEWAHFSSYDVGLNSGSSASHILVHFLGFHLKKKKIILDLLVFGGFLVLLNHIFALTDYVSLHVIFLLTVCCFRSMIERQRGW